MAKIKIGERELLATDYKYPSMETYKAYFCEGCYKSRKFTVLNYNAPDGKAEVQCNGCATVFLIRRYL